VKQYAILAVCFHTRAHPSAGGGCRFAVLPNHKTEIKKKTDFVDITSKVLHDFLFTRYHPLKIGYVRILKK
jgi:hypothetical protein